MSLHILIGHEKPGQRGTAKALYVGSSGSDLQQVKSTATCGSFTILNNPLGLRKSNVAHNPAAPFPVNNVTPVNIVTIPEDIKGLKKDELATALTAAIARIKELEGTAKVAAPEEAQIQTPEPGDENAPEK